MVGVKSRSLCFAVKSHTFNLFSTIPAASKRPSEAKQSSGLLVRSCSKLIDRASRPVTRSKTVIFDPPPSTRASWLPSLLNAIPPCPPVKLDGLREGVSIVLISRQLGTSQILSASLIVTSFLPSALKAINETPSAAMNEACVPESVCTSPPVVTSQILTELLPAAAARKRPSPLKAKTGARLFVFWPPLERSRNSRPVAVSHNLIVLLRNVAVASRRPSGLNINRVAPKKLL